MRRQVVASLLFAVVVSCAAATPSTAAQRRGTARKPATPTTKGPCALTPEWLAGTDWRLYSRSFQVARATGIAIKLKADGTVACDDISWVTSWKLDGDEVKLLEQDGTVAYAFRLDADACVLTSLVCADESTQTSAMGPRGTNFETYFARACPARFGKRR